MRCTALLAAVLAWAGLDCAVPHAAGADIAEPEIGARLPRAPLGPQAIPSFDDAMPGVTAPSEAAAQLPALHVTLASLPLILDGSEISDLAPAVSLLPAPRPWGEMPELRWQNHPRGAAWTAAVMHALWTHGAALTEIVPADIDSWCPGYREGGREARAAFWAGLVSALAWHESTHRPGAVGGGGQWYGLVQILPSTARLYDCAATTGPGLTHGPSNLRCGIRIMAETVARDGVVARNMRGVAADWGPFHSRRKREEMRTWVRSQAFCRPPPPTLGPVPRPAALVAGAASAGAPPTRPLPRPDSVADRAAAIAAVGVAVGGVAAGGVTRSTQDE